MTLRREEGDNTLVLHKNLEGDLLIFVTGNFVQRLRKNIEP